MFFAGDPRGPADKAASSRNRAAGLKLRMATARCLRRLTTGEQATGLMLFSFPGAAGKEKDVVLLTEISVDGRLVALGRPGRRVGSHERDVAMSYICSVRIAPGSRASLANRDARAHLTWPASSGEGRVHRLDELCRK